MKIYFLRQGDWKLVQRPSGTSDWIEEPGLKLDSLDRVDQELTVGRDSDSVDRVDPEWIEKPENSHNPTASPRFVCLLVGCIFFGFGGENSHRVLQAGPTPSSGNKRHLHPCFVALRLFVQLFICLF